MYQGACGYCGRYVEIGDEHYQYGTMYHRRGGCARQEETPIRETPVKIKTFLRAFCRIAPERHEQCSGVGASTAADYYSVCSCTCHAAE